MREQTLKYLLNEIPKIKKLFVNDDEANIKLEFSTLAIIAVIVDQCGEIIDRLGSIDRSMGE